MNPYDSMQDRSKGEITPVGRQATSAWAQVPKYQRAPPPPRKSTRPVHLALTILILGFAVLYAQRNGSKRSKTLYGAAGKDLPDYYAICSKDGAGVYTVPVAGGSGATECVVVGGKEVLDSGSLSELQVCIIARGIGSADTERQDTKEMGRQAHYRRRGRVS